MSGYNLGLSMKPTTSLLLIVGITVSSFAWAQGEADDNDYIDIPTDLTRGMELNEVAERAHDNTGQYYELQHGHPRDDNHDHGAEAAFEVKHFHDEQDYVADEDVEYTEDLSAYDAVGEIWLNARAMESVDAASLDIVNVVIAVIDSWTACDDTYGAVKRGVELMPDSAAEIAAIVAIKKDCNCTAGGLWPQQRVEERLRADFRHAFIDVPRACSCSQAAMYGAISGLPENTEYITTPEEDEAELARITAVMVEKSNEIIERTNAAQNRNDWECGCTGVNLAATMRGIQHEDLREGTWEGLAQKYVDEAGDSGLVVDAFGTVGMHPMSAWGNDQTNSSNFTLRRQSGVYRGDPLILDPFDPSLEWFVHTDNEASGLQSHVYDSVSVPTDVFLSEYVEGWNKEALEQPVADRDPDERNRVLELYNGSPEPIDLGSDQYFLEIYGTGSVPIAAPPPVLERHTLSIDSGVTFELDKWEVRAEASETLQSIVEVLNNADIFSEILIVGHTCDLASDEYNELLSDRRAQSVRDFLESSGLQVDSIRTEGHGEREPRVANISEENRSQNRRVEITFVTRGDREIQRTVSEADGKCSVEFSWVAPNLVATAAAGAAIPLLFGDEHWVEGEREPREVIGLNGQIEAGGTFIIAHENSDEEITDLAQVVTGQLDFLPTDTLVLRRFGGEMALACNAQSYAFLFNNPPGIILLPEHIRPRPIPDPICTSPTNCDGSDQASPN
ncbi:MAG: outer membrane protein OmpA-like peptidoglycan-associated protein [Planctomycetaceae bacterium]|jgi:outer membrane protein OmpA-like peptidoglycan-associated protein